jgi:hypothetical protein
MRFKSGAHLLTESELRRIAREPRWDRQRVLFHKLLSCSDEPRYR